MSHRSDFSQALLMQNEFGDAAVNAAAERADKCLVKGDKAGYERWKRVCAMIKHIEALSSTSVH